MVNVVRSVIKSSELTVLNVSPLLLLKIAFQVLELVFSVGLPGDVIVVDCNLRCIDIASVVNRRQAESVVEETLGNEAARVSWIVIKKGRSAWYN